MIAVADSTIRQTQRELFWIAFLVALIPVLIQLMAAGFIWLKPVDQFVSARAVVDGAAFWIGQLITLSVAIGGSSIVAYARIGKAKRLSKPYLGLKFIGIWVGITLLGAAIALTLIDETPAGWWLAAVGLLGFVTMLVSYAVDVDLALIDAGAM